jgi:ABC-type nickel/cobalt efflux system permease component RcnA
MKKLPFIFLLVLAAIFLGMDAHANPFVSGKPSPANSFVMNFFSTPFLQQVLQIQRQIHEALTNQIEALKEGKSLAALWGLLLMSFGYGIFHVLAPGHGKVIVTSYFIGNEAKWIDGVWAGLIMSVGHTITAVGVVIVLYLLLGLTQFGVLANARYVELLGYGLISAIGIWLLWKAVKNKPECSVCHEKHHGHAHAHKHEHEHASIAQSDSGKSLFAVASLVPCSGSMIILLFTVANGVLWAGVLAVIAIALGMWLTITAIGTVSIFLRRVVLESEEKAFHLGLIKIVRVLAALVVVATGGLLFIGTLYSLGT